MRDAVVAGVVTGKGNLLGTGFAEELRQPVPLGIIGKETIGRRDVLGSVIGFRHHQLARGFFHARCSVR